ncbi:hypothetical protein CHN50_17500 [Priestia aryabhattai]|nr:hypothetical protein CHN50_17500 [Priestia aryabhattai]
MPIVATLKWTNEKEVVTRLERYFKGLSKDKFLDVLVGYGMCPPSSTFMSELEKIGERRTLWKKIKRKFELLKHEWGGPDIPVFLLPSNPHNHKMQREFHGRAGVAFTDKIFVLLTTQTTDEEVLSVLTHEYHHACRLMQMKKSDRTITLLDAMLMEGLAELAVNEYCGKVYLAPWTAYYTYEEVKRFWNKYVEEYIKLTPRDKKYDDLLYGHKWYPTMLGYNIGYQMISKISQQFGYNTKQFFQLTSEEILSKSTF